MMTVIKWWICAAGAVLIFSSGCDELDLTCEPECAERECGVDPLCGKSCGVCGDNETCSEAGRCECPNTTCGDSCCAAGQVCRDSACVEKAREFESLTSGGARISSESYRMELFVAPIHPVGTTSSTNYCINYGPGAVRSKQ